ncbi:unnamed protein product, partial [marine sediment metagenome]
ARHGYSTFQNFLLFNEKKRFNINGVLNGISSKNCALKTEI